MLERGDYERARGLCEESLAIRQQLAEIEQSLSRLWGETIWSRTPECIQIRAEAANSLLLDAGDAGHVDPGSGHGPWPEGLMRFAAFIARL